MPVVDFRDSFTRAAIGNLELANCGLLPEDVATVDRLGVLPGLEMQAHDRFTLVHSTFADNAAKIQEEGYDFRTDMHDARFGYSFAHVVPPEYPNAREINRVALAYRYRICDTKLVFQFPFPFPAQALEQSNRYPWGYTPLNDYGDRARPFIEENERGNSVIPPRYIAGVINLTSGQTTFRSDTFRAPSKSHKIADYLTAKARQLLVNYHYDS